MVRLGQPPEEAGDRVYVLQRRPRRDRNKHRLRDRRNPCTPTIIAASLAATDLRFLGEAEEAL
jgi:hypothetical protein